MKRIGEAFANVPTKTQKEHDPRTIGQPEPASKQNSDGKGQEEKKT